MPRAFSVGVLAVSALITLVTGSLLHWFPVALGIIVGVMAVPWVPFLLTTALSCAILLAFSLD